MTTERWQTILRIMDEAYADYLTGMAVLRKRVVGDVKRKLSDGGALGHGSERHCLVCRVRERRSLTTRAVSSSNSMSVPLLS